MNLLRLVGLFVGSLGAIGINCTMLKITGSVDWSWWVVLSPFFVAFFVLFVIFMITRDWCD